MSKQTLMNTLALTTLLFGDLVSASQCSGCNSANSPYCVELNPQIFGCYGEFDGGLRGSEASAICGYGYHICESADEATDLGLTTTMCDESVPTDHVFFSLESSDGNWQCNSQYDTSGVNDVWGCAGAGTNINTCRNPPLTPECGPFNFACGQFDEQFDAWRFCDSFNECHTFEQSVMSITDDSQAGVLCCVDEDYQDPPSKAPTEEPTEQMCYEYIDVLMIDPMAAMYLGRYDYQGLDSNQMPEYVSENGLGRITLARSMGVLVLKIEFDGNVDRYQSEALISELIDGTYYEMSMNNIFDGWTEYEWTSEVDGVSSLKIIADLVDCQGMGLDNVVELLAP